MTGFNVAKRLAIIQADIWRHKGEDDYQYDLNFLTETDNTPQSIHNASAMSDIISTGHQLQRTKHGFICTLCRAHKVLTRFRDWGNTICKPRPPPQLIAKRKWLEKQDPVQETDLQGNRKIARLNPPETALSKPSQHCTEDNQSHECTTKAVNPLDDPEACYLGDGSEDEAMHELTPPPDEPPPDEVWLSTLQLEADQDTTQTNTQESVHHCGSSRVRRLTKKTKRQHTVYAKILPEGSRLDQVKRNKTNKATRAVNRKAEHLAKKAAINVASRNTTITNNISDKVSATQGTTFDWSFADAIHQSHNIKAVHGHCVAIYCDRCSYYNNGGPLRKLKDPCTNNIATERKYLYSCLVKGIVPCNESNTSARQTCPSRGAQHLTINHRGETITPTTAQGAGYPLTRPHQKSNQGIGSSTNAYQPYHKLDKAQPRKTNSDSFSTSSNCKPTTPKCARTQGLPEPPSQAEATNEMSTRLTPTSSDCMPHPPTSAKTQVVPEPSSLDVATYDKLA